MDWGTPGFPVHHQHPELYQTHAHKSVMPSKHLILYYPHLLLPSVFSSESVLLIRWPKYGASASVSVLPMNIQDWFPLRLTSLISLLSENSQESSPAPQVECINCLWSTFFMVQFSLPYMTTGKAIAFAIWTFVGKVMSLLFNMLCRFVKAFLPRSKCLLISWLQSPFCWI